MSEPEKVPEAEETAPTTISMTTARQCAKCFVISEKPNCPVCAGETTSLVVPQHIVLDQLVRHVVSHIASLGSKIDALTEEIRTQNRIETDKKRYSELKNKLLASLSKTLKEDQGDGKSGK